MSRPKCIKHHTECFATGIWRLRHAQLLLVSVPALLAQLAPWCRGTLSLTKIKLPIPDRRLHCDPAQLVLAIIVMGCTSGIVGFVKGQFGTGYVLFMSILTMLVAPALIFLHRSPQHSERLQSLTGAVLELVGFCVFFMLWMSAAAVLTDNRRVCIWYFRWEDL